MKNRKSMIILSGIILTLVLTLSISYAFFYYVAEGEEISLTSGSISINFSEGTNYISLSNSYPKSDIMGKIDPNYYDFTVSGSKGENDDILYEIQIEPEAGNTLDEKYVKVYLTDQDNEFVTFNPKKVSELKVSEHNGNRVIYDKFINEINQTHDYRIRIWIDQSYTENVSKTFNFKINLYAVNGKGMYAYDTVESLNGTNGVVAVNTDGDFASDGDTIREYRYSGSAKYCTYTIDGNTYQLNVDGDTCPSACYTGTYLYRYDNENISVMGNSCSQEVVANETKPIDGEVNNYVWYNDEMWRIIGAFSETTESGKAEQVVKIVRDEPLLQEEVPSSYTYNGTKMTMKYTSSPYNNLKYANIFWNYSKYFSQTNYNDWTQAGVQYYLNDETSGTSSYYNTLSSMSKEMIETVVYHIGNVDYYSNTTKTSYNHERGTSIWEGNQATWTGKIGLMYLSDYGYATDKANWNIYLYNYYSLSNTGHQDNWIHDDVSRYEWLISPSANLSHSAMNVIYNGNVADYNVNYISNTGAVSPVLYLKSQVRIVEGDGSENNPYRLGW